MSESQELLPDVVVAVTSSEYPMLVGTKCYETENLKHKLDINLSLKKVDIQRRAVKFMDRQAIG